MCSRADADWDGTLTEMKSHKEGSMPHDLVAYEKWLAAELRKLKNAGLDGILDRQGDEVILYSVAEAPTTDDETALLIRYGRAGSILSSSRATSRV